MSAARVLIVGAGGLGSPAALYLAAAGVGTIGLVDFDRVEVSNLQRQILHGTQSIGRSKLDSATERLRDLNPEITIEPIEARLAADNALAILGRFDLTLDGTDNFATRYLINDASVMLGTPYVHGSIFQFEGQVSVFGANGGPCYRCLFPEPPPLGAIPNCAEAGVLGVLPGVIGTLQATEAIKLILGIGEPLIGRLLLYDARTARFREMAVERKAGCPICGPNPSITRLLDDPTWCGPADDLAEGEISVEELARLSGSGTKDLVVVDVREPWEWDLGRIKGSIHLPLARLPERLGELDPAVEVIAVCHKGVRSEWARQVLVGAGFRARSLAGGVDAWAERVDRAMPRY